MSQTRYLPDCDADSRNFPRDRRTGCETENMLSWAAHKPLEHTFAAHVLKKRLWAAKVVKILHGLSINSMGFFNFLMGRTGKRKDA